MESPGQDAEDRVTINALQNGTVCFFHARVYPDESGNSHGRCRFSHDEVIVPYGYYLHKNTHHIRGPTAKLKLSLPTTMDMLSACTAAEDRTAQRLPVAEGTP